jgi:mitogen-activated protein kinase kinase kinase 11
MRWEGREACITHRMATRSFTGLFLIVYFQAGILRIARDVACGMSYLHSLSICHGDLKCENVLLARGGTPAPAAVQQVQQDAISAKVSDFGLSRAMGSAVSHLSTNTVGTVTHMPPELLCSGQLRPAADVYSFGIMLWQVRSRVACGHDWDCIGY